jgi:nucleoside-diphosphate kinase
MLAGPWDVDIARELFPESIRGRLGHDKVRSVVHCTDLEEDAKLEVQYCFRIMV